MYRLTIVPVRDERHLIDGGGYLVVTRDNKIKLAQWQNGRGAFFTERSEGRQGEWTDTLSISSVAGWARVEHCKFEFVNAPKPPTPAPKPEPPKPEPVSETSVETAKTESDEPCDE